MTVTTHSTYTSVVIVKVEAMSFPKEEMVDISCYQHVMALFAMACLSYKATAMES